MREIKGETEIKKQFFEIVTCICHIVLISYDS